MAILKRAKGVSSRIKGEWAIVGLIIIKNVLVSAVSKDFVPFWEAKVGQLVRIRGNGRKPVMEHDVELGSNGAGLVIEDQGNH